MDITQFSLEGLESFISGDLLRGIGFVISIPFIIYLTECFFGYRLFRIKCGIYGFAAGFVIGLFIADVIPLTKEWQLWMISCLLGLFAAFSAIRFVKFGVFFMNAISGFTLGLAMGGIYVALAAALIVGLVAVFLQKPTIIVTTAYSGGMGLAGCIVAMIGLEQPWGTVIGFALMAGGILIQFFTTKSLK